MQSLFFPWSRSHVRCTRSAGVGWVKLRRGVACLTVVIDSLPRGPPKHTAEQRGWQLLRFHLQNRQNANEIDSAGDNSSVESDSQANLRNQTKILTVTTTLKRKAALSKQTKKTFTCVLSDRAIAVLTSPFIPGVACEDKYCFTMGRWGASPPRCLPLPCKQALRNKPRAVDRCLLIGRDVQ